MTTLLLAWRHLLRGWRRSAVVVAGIAVGLSGCLLMVAWSNGLVRQMTDGAVQTWLAHVAVHARGYNASPDVALALPEEAGRIVARLSDAQGAHVSPRLRGDGLVQSARRSLRAMIAGVEPERERDVSIVAQSIVAGSFLGDAASRRARALPPVVIGAEMAKRLRVEVGDRLVLRVPGDAGAGAFRVGGLFRTASASFDRSAAFIRLADAQRLLEAPGRVTEVAVLLERLDEIEAFRGRVRAGLSQGLSGTEVEVLTWQEREPRLAAMLGLMGQMAWVLYAAIFAGAAFGIANALLMAVYERIREFGVLRSLGLRASRLLRLVVVESLMLTFAGAGLGLGLGVLTSLWLGEVGIDLARFSDALGELGVGHRLHPSLAPEDLVPPTVLAGVTAVLAGLWPALTASRLRPAEALRHV